MVKISNFSPCETSLMRTGFQYTQTKDRLWRKNRQTGPSRSCVGTDVNRNWPFKWDTPGGSSTNPCDETYRGMLPRRDDGESTDGEDRPKRW